MRLFPESEKWVCTKLIKPTTNEIGYRWIDKINRCIMLGMNKGIEDYTFYEFVNLLNGILSGGQFETEEIKIFKDKFFNNHFSMFGLSYINDWDLCGILLVIKKIKDEKLTTCENPLEFIENTMSHLTPVTNIVDEDCDLLSSYCPKNFTYSEIENDDFMSEFFENVIFGLGPITISIILNKEEYSFLLLNENFKRRIYVAIDEGIFNDIEPYIINIDFIRTLLKYQPKALRLVGDVWRNNREIVILAVTNNGLALEFASNEFKSDREIVKLAVINNGLALEFATNQFRSDREILVYAVTNNKNSAIFASEKVIVAAVSEIYKGLQCTDLTTKSLVFHTSNGCLTYIFI